MEEEKKEPIQEEEVVLEDAQLEEAIEEEQPIAEEDLKALNKKGLIAFILACIALFVLVPVSGLCFLFCFIPYVGWILSPVMMIVMLICDIAGIVLSAIAMKNAKKAKAITQKPFKVFRLMASIFGPIALAFSIIALVALVALIILAILALIGLIIYLLITVVGSVVSAAMQETISSVAASIALLL